jgi:hypothetical protein
MAIRAAFLLLLLLLTLMFTRMDYSTVTRLTNKVKAAARRSSERPRYTIAALVHTHL